ncbi:MAG: PilT/PilU family type 4a pilus ATPase [Verrucomicrobiota bacterium JB022]|nr:PilT/PilU family type 4a pilus ATPase [Verrucomicrobiota bacterium JB022]
MAAIDQLLQQMLADGGSDLHLSVGMPPKIRASGSIAPLKGQGELTGPVMEKLLSEITSGERWNQFRAQKDFDLAYEIPGVARFRGSYLFNHWGMGAVFRQIPAKILSFDTLKLPEVLRSVCGYREGLVLVTGPTGSGKSTTLAAMIDYINDNFEKHIITIEDPIEFVHPRKKSVIVHREVGEHSGSFANALKGAMRAGPDILLVGEMRDLETIRLALNCASMGMLVFGTLHTNNAPKTVDRIIDAFPADEQPQIRVMLASCLSCVVSQLLCKKVGGGRVAAHEILLRHDALPNTIRTGSISNIRGIIEGSSAEGMCLMDNSLLKLLRAGTITGEEAYMKSADKEAFEPYLS